MHQNIETEQEKTLKFTELTNALDAAYMALHNYMLNMLEKLPDATPSDTRQSMTERIHGADMMAVALYGIGIIKRDIEEKKIITTIRRKFPD